MPTAAEMIEFLLGRRYPDHQTLSLTIKRSKQLGDSTSALSRRQSEMSAYDEHLRALAPESLEATYEEELAAHKEEVARAIEKEREKAEEEERRRFFNFSDAEADFTHWSKAAYWTLDEAVALSLGKEPEVVTWDRLEPLLASSPFAAEFARLRDLVMRAKATGQLPEKVYPEVYLSWAKRYDIDYPSELGTEILARAPKIQDWQELRNEVADAMTTGATEDDARGAGADQEVANLIRECDELKRQIKSLQSDLEAARADAMELSTRERDSLLKLVIGMACEGYRYDPAAQRNSATTEIVDDLQRLGIPLDPDTVRKWLRKAAALLPQETPED